MAATSALGADAARRKGSSPFFRTYFLHMLRNCITLKERYKEYRQETHLKISFCKFLKELQYSRKDINNIIKIMSNKN